MHRRREQKAKQKQEQDQINRSNKKKKEEEEKIARRMSESVLDITGTLGSSTGTHSGVNTSDEGIVLDLREEFKQFANYSFDLGVNNRRGNQDNH